MTACSECGHRRELDRNGLVEAHTALVIDYDVPAVTRAPCDGGGEPPALREGQDEAAEQQLALFDVG